MPENSGSKETDRTMEISNCFYIFNGQAFVENPGFKGKIGKYGNRKTLYNGNVFDSLKEAKECRNLDIKLKNGLIKKYERQVPYPVVINGQKICKYVLDFKVELNNGKFRYLDVKGMRKMTMGEAWADYLGEKVKKGKKGSTQTKDFRIKKKLVEAIYNIKIELV